MQDLHDFQAIWTQEQMMCLDFHDEPNATGHSIQLQDDAILMMVQPIKETNKVRE